MKKEATTARSEMLAPTMKAERNPPASADTASSPAAPRLAL
jgi:hypothetical protein